VALWGHGVNLQADGRLLTRTAEAVKRRATMAAHWFFAYTEGVASRIRDLGFPAGHITVVQNALDTRALRRAYLDVAEADVAALRRRHGITGSRVGLYLGSLYTRKRLGFLLESALSVRDALGDFELIVAGTGPDAGLVRRAADRHPWIHAVGPVFGAEKAAFGRLADVMLMPGLVGLAVLDSFALETPLLTTAVPYHSPEIEYLQDGVNGVVLPAEASSRAYGTAVATVLRDRGRLAVLRAGCRDGAARYTVAEMSARCADGVGRALRHAR
jgi:glycosyltransferase involved in cell wall biosynthesis